MKDIRKKIKDFLRLIFVDPDPLRHEDHSITREMMAEFWADGKDDSAEAVHADRETEQR